MSIDGLPPLDRHAHVGDIGATPVIAGARIFGQTLTPSEWDDFGVRHSIDGLVWGLGLHPIYTASLEDVDDFLARLPDCQAVGEVGLDHTGLSPLTPDEQRTVLADILSSDETRSRLVSLHGLLATAELVAMLADHPMPGAIIHWYGTPGKPLARADQGASAQTGISRSSFRNAVMQGVDASGTSANHDTVFSESDFTGADLSFADLAFTAFTFVDLTDAVLTGAVGMDTAHVFGVVWSNTECPDGTNSDDNAGTCEGHLVP